MVVIGVGDMPGEDGRGWGVCREAMGRERVKRAFGVVRRMEREKAKTTRRWMGKLRPLEVGGLEEGLDIDWGTLNDYISMHFGLNLCKAMLSQDVSSFPSDANVLCLSTIRGSRHFS